MGSGRARLQVADLAYTYEGRTPTRALDGVTVEVGDDEFLEIIESSYAVADK